MCRPGDVILGAALDHRSRSEKTSLVNISPSTGCQPARGEKPQGSGEIISLGSAPGELKGAQVKSGTDKDEKGDTESY